MDFCKSAAEMENGNDRSSESVQETLNILRCDMVSGANFLTKSKVLTPRDNFEKNIMIDHSVHGIVTLVC